VNGRFDALFARKQKVGIDSPTGAGRTMHVDGLKLGVELEKSLFSKKKGGEAKCLA
jgi:hypothetical protein